MKIVNIVPGFGGSFYCGNCLRDSVFADALKESGHKAITLPVYLPLTMDGSYHIDKDIPVFYGAVNIYLKQNFKVFRHMPGWMEDFFNSDPILKYAAKKAGSTRASGLEDMTISMLKGAEGNQKEELEQLIHYLKHHEKPDVVHLSNALLLGFARKIKTELNIPVVCSLQDEDVWIDAMDEEHQKVLWNLLAEKGQYVDAFVSVSQYFADLMQKNMQIPDDKLHIVHIGVDPKKYEMNSPNVETHKIGYLSRMNEENGFGMIVDAFILLKQKAGFEKAQLKASGGQTGDDKKYINQQLNKLKKYHFQDDIEFVDEYKGEKLKSYFKGLSVLSVPVLNGEAFGLYQLESMASGIPMVQPALGAFPEVIKLTNGGVIYEPNTPEALADKLAEVLSDPELLATLSRDGHKNVVENFNSDVLSNRMIDIYDQIIEKNKV